MLKNTKILSLKYRPQTFKDLIGQETTSQTIYNSIKFNKIPNAYLFTGIRGVGKTTIARIIAKSLNCENGIDNLCQDNFCKNCESIINSNHIDVLEIDAASKTGVDDVRDLIEFSRYGPTSAKYKIFIIDEVHMLSKQAFNALLKTLEEPPEYLKFIFATTEIKKIPVTIISRCQRFDLSRIKSEELLSYLVKVKDLEKGKLNNDVLKLIVKISEGSVRDALSLLDRILISGIDKKDIDLNYAQKIFGYLDKSSLIQLFKYLLEGNEEKVISIYRHMYESGIDSKVFINDFLEILYFLKNISSLNIEGTNFSLNDSEFSEISALSKKINPETLLLFWQFTIKTMDELELVVNQNLSVEMFLIRLLHLKEIKKIDKSEKNENLIIEKKLEEKKLLLQESEEKKFNLKNKTISQIKNISQEEKIRPKSVLNQKNEVIAIKEFNDLIDICDQKKEIKLKYELETNVNLVSFENQRLEISFNDNLEKNFVKNLSTKLFEWTNQRWIITLSQKKGLKSKKEIRAEEKENLSVKVKKGEVYKKIIEIFPDAELIDISEKE